MLLRWTPTRKPEVAPPCRQGRPETHRRRPATSASAVPGSHGPGLIGDPVINRCAAARIVGREQSGSCQWTGGPARRPGSRQSHARSRPDHDHTSQRGADRHATAPVRRQPGDQLQRQRGGGADGRRQGSGEGSPGRAPCASPAGRAPRAEPLGVGVDHQQGRSAEADDQQPHREDGARARTIMACGSDEHDEKGAARLGEEGSQQNAGIVAAAAARALFRRGVDPMPSAGRTRRRTPGRLFPVADRRRGSGCASSAPMGSGTRQARRAAAVTTACPSARARAGVQCGAHQAREGTRVTPA